MSNFLLRCFTWDHTKRATAQELLDDPWLKMKAEYDEVFLNKTHSYEWYDATHLGNKSKEILKLWNANKES